MTDIRPKRDRAGYILERYRIRLGFWQAIWVTMVTGGVAVAIPAGVEAYKARLELKKSAEENKLKDKEIALKDKELEGKILDSHQKYISEFLTTALNQDIELRMLFSEYFAAVSNHRYKEGWEKFREGLEKRRDMLRQTINQKEEKLKKIGLSRTTLDVSEQTEVAQLDRELRWYYAELGYVRQDSNVSAPPLPRTIDDFGKDFNGPLVPVTAAVLLKALGPPNGSPPSGEASPSDSPQCIPIDGSKLRSHIGEFVSSGGEKIQLIKPAAESLGRIMSKLAKDDAELVKMLSFVETRCAIYNAKTKTFDPSSWLVNVTVNFGGKPGALPTLPTIFRDLLFTPIFSQQDPFALISLEKIARYFREENWYWRAGDQIKRPNSFIVSASLFEKWVGNGEFK